MDNSSMDNSSTDKFAMTLRINFTLFDFRVYKKVQKKAWLIVPAWHGAALCGAVQHSTTQYIVLLWFKKYKVLEGITINILYNAEP